MGRAKVILKMKNSKLRFMYNLCAYIRNILNGIGTALKNYETSSILKYHEVMMIKETALLIWNSL